MMQLSDKSDPVIYQWFISGTLVAHCSHDEVVTDTWPLMY